MTIASMAEFDFRNDLALQLLKIYATRPSLDETLVERTFDVADRVVARIKADEATLNAELINKAAMARAARQTEFNELVGSMKPGKIEVHHRAFGDGQSNKADQRDLRQNSEAQNPLRRTEDKIEVREMSTEQAIDMITSLFHAAKR